MAPNCVNHKKEIQGISDMKQLAKMIGDLHYETLSLFLTELDLKINADGCKYYNEGRRSLGIHLVQCSQNIREAATCMQFAWEISKPFMKNINSTTIDGVEVSVGDITNYGVITEFVEINGSIMMHSDYPYGTWPIEIIKK